MERTASDHSMVLYSYPPNLGEAGRDEINGVELVEVDVCFTTSDGRLCKTLLNVRQDTVDFKHACVKNEESRKPWQGI